MVLSIRNTTIATISTTSLLFSRVRERLRRSKDSVTVFRCLRTGNGAIVLPAALLTSEDESSGKRVYRPLVKICGLIPIAIRNFVFSGSRLGSYLELAIEPTHSNTQSIARIGRLSNFQRWPSMLSENGNSHSRWVYFGKCPRAPSS